MPNARRVSSSAAASGQHADSDEQDNWSAAGSENDELLDGEPGDEGDGTTRKRKIRPETVSCELVSSMRSSSQENSGLCSIAAGVSMVSNMDWAFAV
jgi:hypothetical protein